MMRKTVLVAGASGVVGRAAIRHFARCDGWDVIGVSRRIPEQVPGARLFNLDLADVEACADLMSRVGADVTHLVFAAQYEAPGLADGWSDAQAIDLNRRMLTNLFEPLAAHATGLEHVSLMQGSKAYGMHDPSLFEQIRVPLRELLPQLDPARFRQNNRSTVVNMACVASAVRDHLGKLQLNLRNRPEKPRVSPVYAHLFRQM